MPDLHLVYLLQRIGSAEEIVFCKYHNLFIKYNEDNEPSSSSKLIKRAMVGVNDCKKTNYTSKNCMFAIVDLVNNNGWKFEVCNFTFILTSFDQPYDPKDPC